MSFDDQELLCERSDSCESFNCVVAMVKNAQIQDDIEFADRLCGEIRSIDLACVHFDAQCRAGDFKGFPAADMGMRPAVGVGGENSTRAAPSLLRS